MDQKRVAGLPERQVELSVCVRQGVSQRERLPGFPYLHGRGVYGLPAFGIGHDPFYRLLGRQVAGDKEENEYV